MHPAWDPGVARQRALCRAPPRLGHARVWLDGTLRACIASHGSWRLRLAWAAEPEPVSTSQVTPEHERLAQERRASPPARGRSTAAPSAPTAASSALSTQVPSIRAMRARRRGRLRDATGCFRSAPTSSRRTGDAVRRTTWEARWSAATPSRGTHVVSSSEAHQHFVHARWRGVGIERAHELCGQRRGEQPVLSGRGAWVAARRDCLR